MIALHRTPCNSNRTPILSRGLGYTSTRRQQQPGLVVARSLSKILLSERVFCNQLQFVHFLGAHEFDIGALPQVLHDPAEQAKFISLKKSCSNVGLFPVLCIFPNEDSIQGLWSDHRTRRVFRTCMSSCRRYCGCCSAKHIGSCLAGSAPASPLTHSSLGTNHSNSWTSIRSRLWCLPALVDRQCGFVQLL